MRYWNTYANLVKRNCASSESLKDLSYWRDNLFAGTIIYLLPLCLIALLPGIFLSFETGQYILGVMDMLTFTGILLVAFMGGIRLWIRKIIFISCFSVLSCALLYYLGLFGPGLLYLLVTCILSILIFPTTYRFWPALLNTCICILFTLAILFNMIPSAPGHKYSAGEWMAVSSNLIFLSFLLATLIPQLFNGLQETLDKEKALKIALNIQQQSLEQKNNELESFAYGASHDLKEPLRMVTSFMGLLKNKYGDQLDEKANTYIDFAVNGGKRMHAMISDLLELSGTARHNSQKELIDLADILKEVKQNIFKLIEESNAAIIVKNELPVLAIYRVDITRLLQNLLSNAIKFRKKEVTAQILLDMKEQEDEWLFSIEDNGIGIEQEKFEKIFEIFARLHSHETYEGTGIGLAVCKKIVEHHGGIIWVESEEGKGSTFYFTIKK